jgi:hypothetical protein
VPERKTPRFATGAGTITSAGRSAEAPGWSARWPLAMFLDGDDKALRAYLAGDRANELVGCYFERVGV